MYVLKSEITVGRYRFSGVQDVRISRSIYTPVESAIIRLPRRASVVRDGRVMNERVVTGRQFEIGDQVDISLGYGTDAPRREFSGYLQRILHGDHIVLECEGASALLRQNDITGFWKRAGLPDLLRTAASGLPGGVDIPICCTADLTFENVVASRVTGLAFLDMLVGYTDGALAIYIDADGRLCATLPYSNSGGDIQVDATFKMGYNTRGESGLRARNGVRQPRMVRLAKRTAIGGLISATSGNAGGVYAKTLGHLADQATLEKVAQEKAGRFNHSGYEGSLRTFLRPRVGIGGWVGIYDAKYPNNDGIYLIEGLTTFFGVLGAGYEIVPGVKHGA